MASKPKPDKHYFLEIGSGKRVTPICLVNHRKEKRCGRTHELPKNLVGHWVVPADRVGDFMSDFRYARKSYRRNNGKWIRRLKSLRSVRPAPAFLAYHQSELKKHQEAKPVFKFVWKP